MANPDSYVYTMGGELGNRLKRKNMADSGCSDLLYNGVDLNRNFPFGFNLSTNSNCFPQWVNASGKRTKRQFLWSLLKHLWRRAPLL